MDEDGQDGQDFFPNKINNMLNVALKHIKQIRATINNKLINKYGADIKSHQGIKSLIHDKFALDFACLFEDFLLGSPAEIGFLSK